MQLDGNIIEKALTQGDLATVFIQPELEATIIDLMDFMNPIRQNLPRKKGEGDRWIVHYRTPGTTAATFVADTDDLVEGMGVYAKWEFPYKTLGTRGKITRRGQAVGRTLVNLMQNEIEAKTKELKDMEDYSIIWGDVATNAKEFDGLNQLVQDYAATQALGTTTTSAGTGDALTETLLDQAIDAVITGEPRMLLCSRRTARQINALIRARQRFVDTIEVKGGFKVSSWNGIPIFKTTNIPDTIIFDETKPGVSAMTGGTTSALFLVDTNEAFMGVLTEVSAQPLANKSSQYSEFDIFLDEALVVKDYRAIAAIYGISA